MVFTKSRIQARPASAMSLALLALTGLAAGPACQASAPAEPSTRQWSYRAIGGFSMGSVSAAFLGLKHHDLFDLLAPLGGPLELAGMMHVLQTEVFGGFCVPPEAGRMCPAPGAGQDHEHLDMGHGVGGTNRTGMLQAYLGAAIAWGNFMSPNPEHPYLPPGVPVDYLLEPARFCDQPARLEGFFDWRFNPDGSLPVITFCDGNGPVPGAFDPAGPHRFPVEIALAVDLDGDGRRGPGEPLLFWAGERFEDLGADGLPSQLEPGYDPIARPDPAGDDFAPLSNPLGTEGNRRWDPGEPFLDHGLDGVPGTRAGPWDLGEGNGVYDLNPAIVRQQDHYDPRRLLEDLPEAALARLSFYLDAGVRDHFRFRPLVETFAGLLTHRGRPVDVRRGFASLRPVDQPGEFDIHTIDWPNVGRDVLVLYGDEAASQTEIEAGDGGHVGTATQLLHRFFALLAFVGRAWPDGDRRKLVPPGRAQVLLQSYPSAILGGERPYFIYLPPGYDERPETRYPVLYLLHGMGMEPELMTTSVLFAEPWMNEGALAKFIIVFPDGRCGEDCVAGTFYANQVGRHLPPRRYEDSLIQELIPHVEQAYRTRPPERLPVAERDD
jgi:S-formylglutathione hydrolase FrmB